MLSRLRSRVILAPVLWTAGLLALMHLLSLLVIHTLPGVQGGHAAVVGTALGALLMFAGFAVAWRSLGPLRGIEQKVAAIETGHATRVEGRFPAEMQPVIDRLNTMLGEREKAVARARAVAGDLAHGLKTPLALWSREADLVPRPTRRRHRGPDSTHDRTDRSTPRARSYRRVRAGRFRAVSVAPVADALVRTLSTLHTERSLNISARIPPDVAVLVRQEDLEEMPGNVMDNACKWAQTRVALAVASRGPTVAFTVEDDGRGLPDGARGEVPTCAHSVMIHTAPRRRFCGVLKFALPVFVTPSSWRILR